MRAAVYRGVNDIRLETLPVPRIGSDELLVKVAVCGVCPTDIKKIQYGTVPPPRIFGHETAGTIVKMGSGVSRLRFGFKLGDRVALHHHIPCLDCHYCRHHAFAQCPTYKCTGITAGFEPAGGGYAEYVRVMRLVLPGVVKIPAKNTFEEGAMLEPVNTVLKAVKRLNLIPGDQVLVAGQGPIGLMFTKILQLRGTRVLATDLLEARLKLAKKFGAQYSILASQLSIPHSQGSTKDTKDGGARLRRGLAPSSLDAAIIAVPSDLAIQQAFQLVRGAGKILLFAHTKRVAPSNQPSTIQYQPDLASICVDEKDLIGSYSADFTLQKEVARLVFSRQLDTRQLITHRFPLDQTAEAICLAAEPTPNSLKIMVFAGQKP